jgi:hypothetical protein
MSKRQKRNRAAKNIPAASDSSQSALSLEIRGWLFGLCISIFLYLVQVNGLTNLNWKVSLVIYASLFILTFLACGTVKNDKEIGKPKLYYGIIGTVLIVMVSIAFIAIREQYRRDLTERERFTTALLQQLASEISAGITYDDVIINSSPIKSSTPVASGTLLTQFNVLAACSEFGSRENLTGVLGFRGQEQTVDKDWNPIRQGQIAFPARRFFSGDGLALFDVAPMSTSVQKS